MDRVALYKSVLHFANKISLKNNSKPEFKFLCECLFGLLVCCTLVITKIARVISSDKKAFKAAYKRLERNLNQYSLLEIQKKASWKNLKTVSKEDIIAIDLGDITKPYSEKMENISKVVDGSDGHKIKNGYWLLGGVAINITSQKKTPLPIELEIFSSSEINFSSENGKIKCLLEKIFILWNKKHLRTGQLSLWIEGQIVKY